MVVYRTYFNLVAPVIDFEAAADYLSEDDMSVYLKGDNRIPQSARDSVVSIDWILRDEQSGYIDLKSERELSTEELKAISNWVSGQNSDGLGEGFEQQEFAQYINEDDNDYDEDEDCYDNNYIMASFDWQSNEYLFEFLRNE